MPSAAVVGLPSTGSSQRVIPSPDKWLVIILSDSEPPALWDLYSFERKATLGSSRGHPLAVSFSRDGEYVLLTFEDSVTVWNAKAGSLRATMKDIENVPVSLAWLTPDGRYVVAGPRLWDARTGDVVLTLDEFILDCSGRLVTTDFVSRTHLRDLSGAIEVSLGASAGAYFDGVGGEDLVLYRPDGNADLWRLLGCPSSSVD